MRHGSSPGFTIFEALLAAALFLSVSAALFTALSSQMTVVRSRVLGTGLDQALQIAGEELRRSVRLAGLGGLEPEKALEIRSQVAQGTRIGRSEVAAGTDVLIVRGALSTRVWDLDLSSPLRQTAGSPDAQLRIDDRGPTGQAQGLAALVSLMRRDGSFRGEPLLLEGLDGEARIVVLQRGALEELQEEEGVVRSRLHLRVRAPIGESVEELGLRALLSEVEIAEDWQPVTASLLEEARFFVHETRGLTEVRMRPGSEVVRPFGEGESWDLAPEVRDFQVAVGVGVPLARGGVAWSFPDESEGLLSGASVEILALRLRAEALRPGRGGGDRGRAVRLVVVPRNL